MKKINPSAERTGLAGRQQEVTGATKGRGSVRLPAPSVGPPARATAKAAIMFRRTREGSGWISGAATLVVALILGAI